MTTQSETTTMTGPEAYAKAVEYAQQAVDKVDHYGLTAQIGHDVQALAAISQAFAAIAQAEATARGSARPGFYPEGGWADITAPNRL